MNCDEIEKLLHAYHDGELSAEDREKVESHLAECPACQKKLAEIKALDELLVDGEAEKVPDPGTHYWHSFPHRVKSRIIVQREPVFKPRRRHRLKFRLLPYLSAGVAILLAIIIAVPFLKPGPKGLSKEEIAKITSPPQKIDIGFERVKKGEAEEALAQKSIAMQEAGKAEPRREQPALTILPSEAKEIGAKGGEADALASEPALAPSEEKAGGIAARAKAARDEEKLESEVSVPTGTLKVVIDSTGKLKNVSIETSSGDPEADSAALQAYREEWEDKTFRHRQRTLLVPFRSQPAE